MPVEARAICFPRADTASEMPAEGVFRIYAFRSGQFAGTVRSVEVRIADRVIGAMQCTEVTGETAMAPIHTTHIHHGERWLEPLHHLTGITHSA